MTIELDGRKMHDRAAAHEHLKAQLGLPDYYGRNLDALYDLLTERAQPLTIVVRFRPELEAYLGSYAVKLLTTLRQAAMKNPALELQV